MTVSPAFDRRLAELSPASDRVWLAGLATGLALTVVHGVTNGRLDYLGARDVVLLESPIWMPVAWACVIVELGYPAMRLYGALRGRMGTRGAAIVASLGIAVAAAVTIGFYEYFAYRAGWWKYEPAHAMIGAFCALYTPLGEAFMFLAILPVAARAFANAERKLAGAIEGGAMFAVAIFLGYALAYGLLEWGRTP